MSAMRPMGEIEEEFDDETVAVLKEIDAKVGDSPTPASDGSDLHQTRGDGINMDAPD